jgi:hypothetical protein
MRLFCPFPSARHPATSWAEEHTYNWACAWGLLPDPALRELFANACFAELMGRAYPYADLDLLGVIADWHSWTYLVDMQLDDHELGRDPATLSRFASITATILGDHPCMVDPAWPQLLQALAEIIARLRPYTTPTWRRRFRNDVGATLTACVHEAHNRQHNLLIGEDAYLHLRPYTSGVYCFLDLIELADSAPLTDAERAHPSIVRLADLATEAIFLANDLVSAAKERLQGDGNNLVLIAERAYALDPDLAEHYVYERYVRAVGDFLRERQQLTNEDLQSDDDALSRYVVGLEYWMRANLDWSELTGRYWMVPGQELPAGNVNVKDEPLHWGVAVRAREVGGAADGVPTFIADEQECLLRTACSHHIVEDNAKLTEY